MKEMNITSNISNGIIHFSNQSIDISEIEWKNHPDYKGVSLKHMITGEKTGGLFSSHLINLQDILKKSQWRMVSTYDQRQGN